MTLRQKYLVYLAVIHAIFLTASALFLRDHRPWLFAVEALFLVSGVVGWRLVRQLTEPLEFVRAGVELMDAADFTASFREVGRPEIDRLIRLYNRMVQHLREERIQGQEQEQLLRRILEISPSGMVSLDLEGLVHQVNPAAERLLGESRDHLIGRSLKDLDETLGPRLAALEENETRVLTVGGRRRVRCRRMSFMDRGFARPFLLLDEMTRELHESEKSAYEKLIRVMSHEINNTSGAVISLLESCLNYRDQLDEEHRDDYSNGLSVAMARTQHMNDFMRAFADVVRLPPPRRTLQDIDTLLENIHRLMLPQFEQRRIRWNWEKSDRFPRVLMDASQMEQALLNVVKNAMEAVGEDGEIVVRSVHTARERPRLEIEDNGGGIPPDVEQRLFTSFFTNKKTGQGIGLTLVQEILLGHGFEFRLENVAAGRARFTIEM